MDGNTIKDALTWLLSAPGAAAVTYFLMENVSYLRNLQANYKRYASLALAAALAMGAFSVMVGLGYQEAPAGWQAWVEALFAVAFMAVGGSQWLHGLRQL
jgi:hypothetical protein